MTVADHAVRAARVNFGGIYQTTHTPEQAESCLSDWCAAALGSGLQTICRFARGLLRAVKGLATYIKHRITSSLVDAFNNQLPRLIHRSRGITNLGFLFLKMRVQSLQQNCRRAQINFKRDDVK